MDQAPVGRSGALGAAGQRSQDVVFSEIQKFLGLEAARDREIRLRASPLYGLLRGPIVAPAACAEDDLDLPGGAAGGVVARHRRKPTTAAERSRARVRFTFQAVEDPPAQDGDK